MRKKEDVLTKRERQIMDVIYKHGAMTARELMEIVTDFPSYSAARAILNVLEKRGYLRHHKNGLRYVYEPTMAKEIAVKNVFEQMVDTYFEGSANKAWATFLDLSKDELNEDELAKIQDKIDELRGKGQ